MKEFILRFILIIVPCCILMSGCGAELDRLGDRMDSLEDRIEALEELCAQINTNIASLQTLVNAVQNNDYITSIAPIVEGEDTVGYIINFTKSGPVMIYHGQDGKGGQDGKDGQDGADGYTPQIGVRMDEDGIYYWTLDGDWLLDDTGNQIPAQGVAGTDGEDGRPGTDGQDGVTPQLKIEDGYWFVSYDNGKEWIRLGQAVGKDGDSFFESVTEKDGYVYFVLSSGETIIVPKAQKLEIVFEETEDIACLPGQTLRLPYTLVGADSETIIECLPKGAWEAEMEITDYASGCVAVTPPDPMTDGKVVVLANNSAGFSDMKILTFTEGTLTVADDSYELDGNASVLEIEVTTNLDYTVHIPEDAASWLSIAPATKSTMRTETLSLSVQEYEHSGPDRSALVELKNGDVSLLVISVTQSSKAISFKDPLVKQILVDSSSPCIDLDGNGEISYEEAALAISIPDFGNSEVTVFEEYQYFVSVTEVGSFYHSALLTDIILPKGVKTINTSAFDGCFALRSMNIPNGVTAIKAWAFNVCSSLESVFIPESVGIIEQGAFQMCGKLATVVIPASVYRLETGAFNDCGSLSKVQFAGSEPPAELGEEIFSMCGNLVEIVVPAGSIDAYKAAPALAPYVDLIQETK